MTEDTRSEAEKQLDELDSADSVVIETPDEYAVSDLETLPDELDVPDPRFVTKELTTEKITSAYNKLAQFDIDFGELTPAQAVEKARELSQKEARFAQVLSRGQTTDMVMRVLSKVPDHLHGQLVHDHENVVPRYESMGFRVWHDPDAAEEGSHRTGDTRVRVGDCILMVIPKEDFAVMDKVRQDRRRRKRTSAQRLKAKLEIERLGVKTIQ